MNFKKCDPRNVNVSKVQNAFCLLSAILLPLCLTGCGDQVRLPSAKQLAEFEKAGPIPPSVDTERLVWAKMGGGSYRLVAGDAVELTMPAILRSVAAEEASGTERVTPYVCRVSESGTITLPRVGEIQAAGKTLAQVESSIIDAYYPKHVVTRPSVFARVLDYSTTRVSISGAVVRPGVYPLRSDQMSLVALLMEAGGIVEQGAATVRIMRDGAPLAGPDKAGATPSAPGPTASQTGAGPLILPIRGLNVPFADVELQDGDRVIVDRLSPPSVTVIGLVNRPAYLPYPPDVRYNLTQVLALAGGLNQVAEPRYATVYRLKPDGSNVSATFRIIGDSELTDAATIPIKPGDIVAVEQTPRTRTALFLNTVFRINIGTYWSMNDAFD
jgi:protein involved in polysaccharide export with SLBB domain